MKRSEKILFSIGLAVLLGGVAYFAIHHNGNYASALGKRISQGIKCVKTGQDCPKD